jgi:replicative DNA helicase
VSATDRDGLATATPAEQATLGALLLDSSRAWPEVAPLAIAEDFSREDHRTIFRAIRDLAAAGEIADAITVSNALEAAGKLEQAGGLAYLVQLTRERPTAVNAAEYAALVRDRGQRRCTTRRVREWTAQLEAGALTLQEFAEAIGGELGDALERATPGADTTLGAAAVSAMIDFEQRADRRDAGRIAGMPTGLDRLDQVLAGLQPGAVYTVAGLTGYGKTALAQHIALAAARAGHPVGIVSREMLARELGARFCSQVHGVNLRRLLQGDRDALAELMDANQGAPMQRLPIFLDDRAGRLEEISARIAAWRQRHAVELVVVDYVQLVSGPSADNRTLEVAAVTRRLKNLAQQHRLAVLALSQFNRGAAIGAASGDRPELHQLRDSGSIEQDSDAVLLLWRSAAQREADRIDQPRQMMLTLAKNRHGPSGDVYGERNPLVFEVATQRFREFDSAGADFEGVRHDTAPRPARRRAAGSTFASRSNPDDQASA